MSNHSAALSASTEGAKGRKPSRNLIFMFRVSRIFGSRGSARMLRPPSARGPNSMRPWNQPITLPSARSRAVGGQELLRAAAAGAGFACASRYCAISSSSYSGPR